MSSDVVGSRQASLQARRDRRGARRVAAAGAVAAVSLDVETDVLSLSRGDMAIVLAEPLDPGSVHSLCLVLGSSAVEIEGAVRSVTPAPPHHYRIGIEFTGVGGPQRALLDSFLGSRLAHPDRPAPA